MLPPAACLFCGCIDSTVDYSDLDKQIGINVDGLKVRLGNTEKMKLADLLKPEGHVKQDPRVFTTSLSRETRRSTSPFGIGFALSGTSK